MPRAFFNNSTKINSSESNLISSESNLNSGDYILKKSFNSKFKFDSSNCIVTNFNNNNNYLSVLKNYNNYCFNKNNINTFKGSIYQGKYLLKTNNNIDVCNKNNFFRNNYDIFLNENYQSILLQTLYKKIINDVPGNTINLSIYINLENLYNIGDPMNDASFNASITVPDLKIHELNNGQHSSLKKMFYNARYFNTDISNWDVSNITIMESMFAYTSSFEGINLGKWKTDSLINAKSMFENAKGFNADISNWNVYNVTNMESMFASSAYRNNNNNIEIDFEGISITILGIEHWNKYISTKFEDDISVNDMFQDT